MFWSRRQVWTVLKLLLLSLVPACGAPEVVVVDAGVDSGTALERDAGPQDGGTPDAAIPDAGSSAADAGAADAGAADAGAPDAGAPDAGTPDAGAPDAGAPDAGAPDAGAPDAGAQDAGSDAGVRDAGPPHRPVTVCLTGACSDFSATCGSNYYFNDLCDALGSTDAGLVRSGNQSVFATAFDTNGQAVVTPLFTALDRNADGVINAADGLIDLNVIGFSWGAVNAGDLAARLGTDARIDHASLFLRLIILDAYQPTFTPNPSVAAAAQVDEAWSFRHRVAPPGDCSSSAPLGPYLGRRLACAASRPCRDFDFSLAPNDLFGGYPGTSIGHCEVALGARQFVLELVANGQVTSALPPSVPVSP